SRGPRRSLRVLRRARRESPFTRRSCDLIPSSLSHRCAEIALRFGFMSPRPDFRAQLFDHPPRVALEQTLQKKRGHFERRAGGELIRDCRVPVVIHHGPRAGVGVEARAASIAEANRAAVLFDLEYEMHALREHQHPCPRALRDDRTSRTALEYDAGADRRHEARNPLVIGQHGDGDLGWPRHRETRGHVIDVVLLHHGHRWIDRRQFGGWQRPEAEAGDDRGDNGEAAGSKLPAARPPRDEGPRPDCGSPPKASTPSSLIPPPPP